MEIKTMKRNISIIIFIFIIVLLCQSINTYAYADIEKIDISYNSPDFNIKDIYGNYTATNENEIQMLSHFLKTLEASPIEGGPPSDSRNISITIGYDDNTQYSYQVYPTIMQGFNEDERMAYNISIQEYYQLCGFINSLILGHFDENEAISTKPSAWAEADVYKAIEDGLLSDWHQIGYTNYISRVETCQLIDDFLRIKGIYETGDNKSVFEDTDDMAVNTLYNMDIINGKSETEFCPYDYITREEVAKILSGLCDVAGIEKNGIGVDYADKNEISDWAVDYVDDMTAIGVFNGDDNNRFNPQDNITKEELIVILVRLNDSGLNTFAEELVYKPGVMIINGVETDLANDVIFEKHPSLNEENEFVDGWLCMLPLKDMLEGLGIDAVWNDETQCIEFSYNDMYYLCELEEYDDTNINNMGLFNIKYSNDKINWRYIILNSMSTQGLYRMLDNSTYIDAQSATLFFDSLGIDCEVNGEEYTVYLNSK